MIFSLGNRGERGPKGDHGQEGHQGAQGERGRRGRPSRASVVGYLVLLMGVMGAFYYTEQERQDRVDSLNHINFQQCNEIESLKAQFREDAIRNYRRLDETLAFLNLQRTDAIEKRARGDRDRVLRRFQKDTCPREQIE